MTLAATHIPYALALARPFRRAHPRLADEIRSSALEGLVEADAAYRAADYPGVPFRRFARYRVVGAIRDCLRNEGRRGMNYQSRQGWYDRRRVSPARTAGQRARARLWRAGAIGYESIHVWYDPAAREPGPAEIVESRDSFDYMIGLLPERDGLILRLIYGHDLTTHDAARRLGLSQSLVSVQAARSLRRLKDFLTGGAIPNPASRDERKKVCGRCFRLLPATREFFCRHRGLSDGLNSFCRACRSKSTKHERVDL